MGRFSIFSRKSDEITATNTFFPLQFVEQYISQLTGSQKTFFDLYLTVPELQAVINYKARVFAGMKLKAIDSRGNEKQAPELDIFYEPNPIQNFKEFLQQYYILRAISGNAFIHPVYGVNKKNIAALWNLPPMNAKVNPVPGSYIPFNMTKKEELIDSYEFEFAGGKIKYEPEEIIHFNDNQIQFTKDRILLGDSKIRPLERTCNNIKDAYEARGILISNSPKGILSNETTDGIGRADITSKEKNDIQEDFRKNYGMTRRKWDVIITNANLKWQAMTTNVDSLKLFEEVSDGYQAICNAYNFPSEVLMPNSTYENKQKALVQLYQEAIIPEADEFLQGLSNWMGIDYELQADFSHVSILQADIERRSRSLNLIATGLAKAIEAGIMTVQEAQEEMKKYLI